LLQKACDSHTKYLTSACDGYGVDRLLLGLQHVSTDLGYQTLEFFEDIGFKKSTNWQLSTSQVSSDNFLVGFGPVSDDSLGICYTLRDNMIVASISSYSNKKEEVEQFIDALTSSLRQMQRLTTL
jgi:carnitine O-acetyltransferase